MLFPRSSRRAKASPEHKLAYLIVCHVKKPCLYKEKSKGQAGLQS
jgi:hypothetical protein